MGCMEYKMLVLTTISSFQSQFQTLALTFSAQSGLYQGDMKDYLLRYKPFGKDSFPLLQNLFIYLFIPGLLALMKSSHFPLTCSEKGRVDLGTVLCLREARPELSDNE